MTVRGPDGAVALGSLASLSTDYGHTCAAGPGGAWCVGDLFAGALGNGVDAGFNEFWWWLPVRVIATDPVTVE